VNAYKILKLEKISFTPPASG